MTLLHCPNWNEGEWPLDQKKLETAYSEAIKISMRKQIEIDDVKGWHRSIFGHSVPLPYYAGNFRHKNLDMPCLEQDVEVGGIAGCPFDQVIKSMERLFADIRSQLVSLELKWGSFENQKKALLVAVIVGELVGEFIKIHPFINGNGRMSRIIWACVLTRFGFSPQFRICPRPEPPYGEIMAECMKGNFLPIQLQVLNRLTPPKHDLPI